jgi:hypothetical protein
VCWGTNLLWKSTPIRERHQFLAKNGLIEIVPELYSIRLYTSLERRLNLSATQLRQFSTVLPGGRCHGHFPQMWQFWKLNGHKNLWPPKWPWKSHIFFAKIFATTKVFAKTYHFWKKILFSRKVLQKSRIFFAKIFSKTKNANFRENFRENLVYFSRKFSPKFSGKFYFNPSWRDLATLVLNDTFRISSEERLKWRHRHRTPIEDWFLSATLWMT